MLSNKKCLRGTKCKPISNISSDSNDFVCIGFHGIDKHDKFRHCFKTETTDSIYDYDNYDLISVISVMSEAILIDHLKTNE